MNTFLWTLAGLLAVVVLAAGTGRLARPQAGRAAAGQGWVEDCSDNGVQRIGVRRVVGSIGLRLPSALHMAPAFRRPPPTRLGLILPGARSTHPRPGELPS